MSLATLERAILAEARILTANPKLRQKDITSWSTGPVRRDDGETEYHLPGVGVNITISIAEPKPK